MGITVTLFVKTPSSKDEFNRTIYAETAVSVDNVLVAPLSDEEILSEINMTGRRAVYHLAIPKGDTHDWENCKVSFFGEMFRVIGKPTKGIDALIPLGWNMKVKVEKIE